MLVSYHNITRRHNPEDLNLPRHKNLISRTTTQHWNACSVSTFTTMNRLFNKWTSRPVRYAESPMMHLRSTCTPFGVHLPGIMYLCAALKIDSAVYGGVSKSFRTGRLERELQMVQLSATRCSCIAILWVILVSFATITLRIASQRMFIFISWWLSPGIFGYPLVFCHSLKLDESLNVILIYMESTVKIVSGLTVLFFWH
jgi:hypothetical protein